MRETAELAGLRQTHRNAGWRSARGRGRQAIPACGCRLSDAIRVQDVVTELHPASNNAGDGKMAPPDCSVQLSPAAQKPAATAAASKATSSSNAGAYLHGDVVTCE